MIITTDSPRCLHLNWRNSEDLPADARIWSSELEGAAYLASLRPLPPAPIPEPEPYRILKDTIIQRIKSMGKIPALRQLVKSLDDDTRFEWDHSSWFHNNTPMLVQGCAEIGLTAEETVAVLAPDPLAE